MDRLAWMTDGLCQQKAALEIAPLDKPLLKRSAWNVEYADHLSTEGLRQKYALHGTVDPDAIQLVDHVLGKRSLVEAVGDRRFNAVLASHVLEHVPDPIRWIDEIFSIVENGGFAVFALPDRDRCFDALRRPSTASDWIGAWLERPARPSPRNVIDALWHECSWQGSITWAAPVPAEDLLRSRDCRAALDMARAAVESPDYYDVHCWVFRPSEFFAIIRTLTVLELIRFSVVNYRPTQGNEFLVKLQRDDDSTWQTRVSKVPFLRSPEIDAALPLDFSPAGYLECNPDLVQARVDPIEHWVRYGKREGRLY